MTKNKQKNFKLSQRTSGILLHPTSLPSRFGIGDLGIEAYRFIDFLSESLQQIWQVLPIGPTGYGNCPYSSYSSLAGNPLLISPEKLQEEGLLWEEDFSNLPDFPIERVDYDLVIKTKFTLLKKASENFSHKASEAIKQEFSEFCDSNAYWLDDYALFMAVKEFYQGASWHQWEKEIAFREPEAIKAWTYRLSEPIFYQKFLQFQFSRQWKKVKEYANEKGIAIFGDIPIYAAHDSVDVWANREIFLLDEETGEAALMAGVPPDYFSITGQLWGNPIYNWEQLRKDDFAWWLERIQGILQYVDIIRIDHFRGFEAFWAVPKGEDTAINGQWIKAPGKAFFRIQEEKLGKLLIIAEDLGVITKEVENIRDKFDFPGMKILQFAFDTDGANPFLPFNFLTRNCVVYTGTHDNNTTVGWFEERSPEGKAKVAEYLGCISPDGVHWSLIRLALGSIANLAIIPLQDVLGLGSDAKMNVPSKPDGNWEWRYRFDALNPHITGRLGYLTSLYGRQPL